MNRASCQRLTLARYLDPVRSTFTRTRVLLLDTNDFFGGVFPLRCAGVRIEEADAISRAVIYIGDIIDPEGFIVSFLARYFFTSNNNTDV